MANSYIRIDKFSDCYLYPVRMVRIERDAVFRKYYGLFTADIVENIPLKVHLYYLYLDKSNKKKIDHISTEIKDGCVGTIMFPYPLRFTPGRTTITIRGDFKTRTHITIDEKPDKTCVEKGAVESIFKLIHDEMVVNRDNTSERIKKLFVKFSKRKKFKGNMDMVYRYIRTTRGSYEFAQMVAKDSKKIYDYTSDGYIMAIANSNRISWRHPVCINYVWVDKCGIYNYAGYINKEDLLGPVFEYKFHNLKCETTISKDQYYIHDDEEISLMLYSKIEEKWKNRYPNR